MNLQNKTFNKHIKMKKILLLLAILPMFMTSCSNDDESTEQTFFVNVYTKWEDSEEKVAKKPFCTFTK